MCLSKIKCPGKICSVINYFFVLPVLKGKKVYTVYKIERTPLKKNYPKKSLYGQSNCN